MNPTEEPIDFFEKPGKMNLPNLIAIGAFLWFFFASVAGLLTYLIRYLGCIINVDMQLIFWFQNILPILIVIIIAWNITRKMWIAVTDKRLDTTKALRRLIFGIIGLQIAQFLTTFFLTEYAYEATILNGVSYFDTRLAIDPSGLIASAFDITHTVLLLFIFVQRKPTI